LPAVPEDDATMSARVLSQIIERSTRAQAGGQGRGRAAAPLAPRGEPARDRHQAGEALPGRGDGQRRRVGSAAAFPGIGTLAALSAVAGETLVFLEATAVFALAVAEVPASARAPRAAARPGARRAGR
jgi:hypothetical protein